MSTFQQLDAVKAGRLLSQSDANAKAHHKDDWIDWEALQAAFKDAGWTTFLFRMHGRLFSFKRRDYEAYVQCVDGLTPCGWFSISQVKRKLEAMQNGG